MRMILAPLAAAAVAATPALAQDTGWSAGLIGIASPSIYAGADTDLRLVPNVTFRGDGFAVGTGGLSFTLFGDRESGIDLVLTPRFAPYDSSDSAALAGMERDFTADAGLAFRAGFASGTRFDGRILQEVTGEHDGQEVDLRLSQSLLDAGLPVEVFGGVTWQSAELSAFLYGVRAAEAVAGRPAYAPGETVTPYLGVGTRFPVGEAASVFGAVQARFLDDAITASPIVSEDRALSATLGVSFSF